MAHKHLSGEGSHSLFVEHILVQLVALAAAHLMVDERVVVHVLLLVGDDASREVTLRTFALEDEVGAVAGHSVVERYHVVVHAAVGLLRDEHVAHPHILGVGLLQAVEVESGVVGHVCLDYLGGEEALVVGCMVAEQQLYLGARLHDDEHAAVYHQVHVGAQDIDYLHSLVHHRSLWHVDHEAVLCKHGVECRDSVFGAFCQPAVVLRHEFGALLGKLLQRAYDDALGQFLLGHCLGVEAVVHHEIERCAQVGHVAAECLIRVYRNLEAVEVQSVVGSEERRHVGIFVSLHLLRGESESLEVLECSVSQVVHHARGVLHYHLAALLIEFYVLFFALHLSG